MTLTQFLKMMTDCELIDEKFNRNNASILFTKLKGKSNNNVSLASFKLSVDMIAEMKECERTVVIRAMRDTKGPKFTNTTSPITSPFCSPKNSPRNSPKNSNGNSPGNSPKTSPRKSLFKEKVDEVIRHNRRQTVMF